MDEKRGKKRKLKHSNTSTPSEPAQLPTPQSETTTSHSHSRYHEDSQLSALPQSEIDTFLASNFISIEDPQSSSLRPIIAFEHLPSGLLAEQSLFRSFKSPTPIQSAAWPYVLSKRDVVGVAETGSGKTLAFGLPCIRRLASNKEKKAKKNKKEKAKVRALILSPTRELALQTTEQIEKLATPANLPSVCIYGGAPKDPQRNALRSAAIVVATPGRLRDFLEEGALDLSHVKFLVLDEADRMLDKGFEEEIKHILSEMPSTKSRQTLMFTATWPQSIRDLAQTFMTEPVKIAVGDNPSGELRANTRIKQQVEVIDSQGKDRRLMEVLRQHHSGSQKDDRILIFCLYKKEAARVESSIRYRGFRVAGIHGDMNQAAREKSLDAFKKGEVTLLVATDVAARGLDIPEVKLVVNVTFPLTIEDYVHRIGRTGRAGKTGIAITFFTDFDKAHSGELINVLKAASQPVPEDLMKFGTTVKKKEHSAYGAFYKDVDTTVKAKKIKFDE
ncbi:MAG: RNA-dependent ATPase [Cirrosporium novae-zelandiae]|nr:MAG: RNA-dependent ATPase [Cirrosporium novae-zelandiae]